MKPTIQYWPFCGKKGLANSYLIRRGTHRFCIISVADSPSIPHSRGTENRSPPSPLSPLRAKLRGVQSMDCLF
jgi:hypothetical protein